jgi:NAD(P)-dependent dehydrogenase (short-subunit alcohol dehydrogenase family)
MTGEALVGKRVIVVGASSGIGRAIAVRAAGQGAVVVAAARRSERLAEIGPDLPGGAVVTADITRGEDCARLVADAVDHLGGLDGLVYAAGTSPLLPMAAATAEDWRLVFDTNVVGAALVTAAAAPTLIENEGRAVLLSSKAARDPFPQLGLYTTSKIALDGLVRCLPVEFPGLKVTRAVVGDTLGTDFTSAWDPDRFQAAVAEWTERGLIDGASVLEPVQVADAVLSVLPGDSGVDDIAIVGR